MTNHKGYRIDWDFNKIIDMVDTEEVYVRDLHKKHNKREEYKGLYSVGKKVNRDDGEIDNDGFALDKENLEILRAKIMAVLVDDLPPKEKKSILN